MTTILNLSFRSTGLEKALSNLFAYPFSLDDTACGSMEGFLQSLKQEGVEEQSLIASLDGYDAYKIGQMGNDWKERQLLWWKGQPYERLSKRYHRLIERAYDACFEQNEAFRRALYLTGADTLVHHMGNHNPTETTLTEWEYIYNMYRLRARAQQMELESYATVEPPSRELGP